MPVSRGKDLERTTFGRANKAAGPIAGLAVLLSLTAIVTAPLVRGGYPRADQLDFVFRLRTLDYGFGDLLAHLDWNRSVIFWSANAPDSLLFRPLSYLLSGGLVLVSGDRFWISVVVNCALHLAVLGCLFTILFRSTRSVVTAVGLSATLTTSPFALELVAWTHIPGYLAFALLVAVFGLTAQRGLIDQSFRAVLWGAGALALSSFFYELGSFLAVLFAFCLVLWRFLGGWCLISDLSSKKFCLLVLTFIGAAALMPAASAVNYLIVYGSGDGAVGGLPVVFNGFIPVLLLGIWTGQWLVPLAFRLEWGTRLNWIVEEWNSESLGAWLQLGLAAFLISAILILLGWKWRRSGRRMVPAFAFLIGAPTSYALLVAAGRTSDRDSLLQLLRINNYYLYFFIVLVLVSAAFFVSKPTDPQESGSSTFERRLTVLIGAFAAGSAALTLPAAVHLANHAPGDVISNEHVLYERSLQILDGRTTPVLIDTTDCGLQSYPWLLDLDGQPFMGGAGISSLDALLMGRTTLTNWNSSLDSIRLCPEER